MAGALIGALRVSLSAETSAFEAGMKRSQRQARQTATGIQGAFDLMSAKVKAGITGFLGALSVGVILRAGKASLDYAGNLGEMSQQLGVTTRDLQVLRYAAGQLNVSQEELDGGLTKLTATLGKIAAGAEAPRKALAAIGISVDDIKNKDTGEAFRLIADGLSKVGDRSQRAAVEVALFGKTGAKLDTLLAGGSDALNELAAAADKLGIVLSDEQIQKADVTADRLEALKTVLSAKIAGDIADNSTEILRFADALFRLVNAAIQARQALIDFQRNYNLTNLFKGDAFGLGVAGRSVTTKLGSGGLAFEEARKRGLKLPGEGGRLNSGAIDQFLRGDKKGKGAIDQFLRGDKKGKADDSERKRLEALRAANQFDQELRRAQIDVLSAQEQLANDYIDRADISRAILDAERAAYEAQLRYQVAAGEITAVQAEQLLLENARVVDLERQKINRDVEAQRAQESARLDQVTYDVQRDALDAQLQLAETAVERRDIELRLLDLVYRQERARLEAVLADEQSSFAAKEEARRRLAGLNATYGADRQGVINATRGPMEDYLASLPTTAAKAQEALEQLQVQGLEGLTDAVLALSDGVDAATDSLLQTLKNFFLGMARLELQKGLGSLLQSSGGLSGIFGSIFGSKGAITESGALPLSFLSEGSQPLVKLHTGGSILVGGKGGVDRNILSLNGLPIARVSYGERINVAPINDQGRHTASRSGVTMNFYTPDADSFRRSQSQVARETRRRLGV